MTDSRKVLAGLALTVLIYVVSVLGAHLTRTLGGNSTLAYMMVPALCFVQSAAAISFCVSRRVMKYRLRGARLRSLVPPILVTLVATFATGVFVRLLEAALGLTYPESTHVSFMSPVQVFFLIFLFGSIAEETLFRGFLQNMLAPLKTSGIRLFRARLSLPVIIGAVLFGCAHFSLLGSLEDLPKIAGVVANATVLGLVAGYYQEKHDNFLHAAVAHLAANLPIVIMAFAA